MKKVLFIAYHFPPLAGGGTFRSLKLVKYLPQFGWLPTVVTTNTRNYWAYDESLLNEVPKEVKIIRTCEFDPFYLHILLSKIGLGKLYQKIKDLFLIPDEKIGWIPFAYRMAKKELKKQKYDLIFSTSPTPCAHIIALKLKKRFGIPWICDIRDYWTTHFTYPYKKTHREQLENHIEQTFFKFADHITTVSQGVKKDFSSTRPPSPISVITNGFDTENNLSIKKSLKFRILYTGSFYGHYNPKIFLQALKQSIQRDVSLQKTIDLLFIGNYPQEITELYQTYKAHFSINWTGFKSPGELEQEFLSANILLLILPSEEHYQAYLPAKLFTYMAKQIPIFAIIPEGEAKEILKISNLGFFANPNSLEDITQKILHLYKLWKTNQLHVQPNKAYINQFHRRNLTKQLVDIFEEVT